MTDTTRAGAGPVLLLEAEENRAFRSMARTITGHLEEGQLRGRLEIVQARSALGSVAIEEVVAEPARRASAAEAAWQKEWVARRPAAVVAFDSLAGLLARRLSGAVEVEVPIIAVVGGLWPDPLWRAVRPWRVVVPDERLGAQFLAWGLLPDAVVPVGLGVCGRFGEGVREGRQGCRSTQGLPLDPPTLLLVTEGLFADDVLEWMGAAARPELTLLVDAAGDRLARQAAEERLAALGIAGRVFGRVDEAGMLWGAADRVVGVALDHLVTRALTYRAPFWAIRPADDRQRGLVAALERLGAGGAVAHPEALGAWLAADDGWAAPLDASRLETVASPGVLPRIAEAITQMLLALG